MAKKSRSDGASTGSTNSSQKQQKKQAKQEAKVMLAVEKAKTSLGKAEKKVAKAQARLKSRTAHQSTPRKSWPLPAPLTKHLSQPTRQMAAQLRIKRLRIQPGPRSAPPQHVAKIRTVGAIRIRLEASSMAWNITA